MKTARTAALCWVFSMFRERTCHPTEQSARLSHGRHRQAAGEAGTKCCPHERGYHGHGTGRERIPATSSRTSYFFSTYRSSFQGGCGLFLFDTFLFYARTYYKRIHGFHYGRACHCAGALFLRFGVCALQGTCAAALVLKLFKQISRLEGI